MRKNKKTLTTYAEAFSYALDKLSYRDYSQKELEGKLQECGCPFAIIQEVMAKLLDCNFINEERYAQLVYRSWLAKKYYGKLHLRQYLVKKVVREDYQKQLLESFTREEEAQRALALASSQFPKYQRKYKDDKQKLKAAMGRTMAAHGFRSEFIWSILGKLFNEIDEC